MTLSHFGKQKEEQMSIFKSGSPSKTLDTCRLITYRRFKNIIKETKKSSPTDSGSTTFGMKKDMKIKLCNVRTLY